MRTHILLCILFIPLSLYAQDNAKIIYPGTPFLNHTIDTLFCLPKHKLETLMERNEINTALIHSFKARNAESDSMLSLKTMEAQGWYSKLLENYKILEESELMKVREQQKARKRTKVWFCAGTLMGLLIGVIL